MFGDGVDPCEEQLLDQQSNIQNLRRNARDSVDRLEILAAAEAALERARALAESLAVECETEDDPGECPVVLGPNIARKIRRIFTPAPAAEQATIKCDRCDGTGTLMNAAGKEYACDSCGGGGRFAKPSAPAGKGE